MIRGARAPEDPDTGEWRVKRPALRSVAIAAALLLPLGCTIDIPQSFYADTAASPAVDGSAKTDTPQADAGKDGVTPPVDAVQADGGADATSPPDTSTPDAVIADTQIADTAADTAGPDADGVADVFLGDVQFPPSCTVDEDCVPVGDLPLCREPRCIDGACALVISDDGTACDDPAQTSTPCVIEQCKAAKCRLVELAKGAPCGVTDACFEDRCNDAGLCVAVSVVDCDDGSDCTEDSCDPETGCKNTPALGAPCDDGTACTTGDACDAEGLCTGAPVECTADPCFKALCNPETGACDQTPDTGALCDDGDPCTSFDKCNSAGSCGGAFKCPKPTGAKAACLKATCSATGECSVVPAPGQSCNDGNGCTVPDACVCPTGGDCSEATITCEGAAVPIGRACEFDKECGYKGAACIKNVCTIECGVDLDCPQPPSNQGTAVCASSAGSLVKSCHIEKCTTKTGGTGTCVDGTCF